MARQHFFCTLAGKPISGTFTYMGWYEQDKIPNPKVFQHCLWNLMPFVFCCNNSIFMHFECAYHRTELSVSLWPIGSGQSQLHLLLLPISPLYPSSSEQTFLQMKEHAFPLPSKVKSVSYPDLPSSPEGLIFLELRTSHSSG